MVGIIALVDRVQARRAVKQMSATMAEILAEIDRKGYTTIEHGRGFSRGSMYGGRRVAARNRLIQAGLIEITHNGHETDARRGRTSFHYWSRVIRRKG